MPDTAQSQPLAIDVRGIRRVYNVGVPFDPFVVNWPLLVVVMAAGIVSIMAIGILLAAICLQTRQEAWSYPEAVAGALFLVSGAVFPLSVLPAPIQAIGLVTPLTWWIEGVRDALFPGGLAAVGGPGSLFVTLVGQDRPHARLTVVALLATGAMATLAAIAVFRTSDRRAKDRGLLDQTTGS